MVDKMIKMNICQRSRLKLLLSALFIAFLSMSGITLAQQNQLQDMQVLPLLVTHPEQILIWVL